MDSNSPDTLINAEEDFEQARERPYDLGAIPSDYGRIFMEPSMTRAGRRTESQVTTLPVTGDISTPGWTTFSAPLVEQTMKW